jgi:DNA repair exonuclease SbcCD nuclease subunit
MTKLLLIPDVHLSDKPPSIRTDAYVDEILEKLRYAMELAAVRGCEAVVQAGDLFHIKTPNRNSHRLVQAVHEVLTSIDLPVYVVPGNHDLSNDRIESLPSQPLGSLARMSGIELLQGPHPTLPLYGLPYQPDWRNLPQILAEYKEWADERHLKDFSWIPLLVTHAPIFPPGEDPPYDYIAAEDWAELMMVGDCYYGHIHDPHGVYRTKAPGVTMCNNGALSRGSLHEKTLKRQPAVTIWDSEVVGERFTREEVPHKPAEEVFRLDIKEATDQRSNRVQEFLSEVGQVTLTNLTVEEVVAHAETAQLDALVLHELRSVIEEVSSR